MGYIRNLKAEEFDVSLQLSQYAFQYSLSSDEIEKRKKRMKPEQVWGYYEDEKLASKLHLFPFVIFLNGKEFEMGGIAGVATWPEHRRKGMVDKLLLHSLNEMKQNGQTVSMLAPFSFDFYRRYGWDIHCEYRKYTIETRQLPSFKKVEGTVKRVNIDLPLLKSMYESFALQYNGMIKRDDEWWTNAVLSGNDQIAVYYSAENKPEAYIIFNVNNREMKVEEFIYFNEESRRGLWNFIRNHDSMIEKVIVPTAIDDKLAFILSDPNVKQEIVTYFMFRIVDVEAFLKQLPLNQLDQAQSLFIHLTDEHAHWNNGTFQVQVSEKGETTVTSHPSKGEGAQCTNPPKRGMICDIQTLSLMLLGFQRPTFLYNLGRIQVHNEEEIALWEKLIPNKSTFLYDYF